MELVQGSLWEKARAVPEVEVRRVGFFKKSKCLAITGRSLVLDTFGTLCVTLCYVKDDVLTLRSYCCSGIEHTHMKKQRKNKVVMVSRMIMQHKVEYIRTVKLEVHVLMWRLLSEQSSR